MDTGLGCEKSSPSYEISRNPGSGYRVSLIELIRSRKEDQRYSRELANIVVMVCEKIADPKIVARNKLRIYRWTNLIYLLLGERTMAETEGQMFPVASTSGQPLSLLRKTLQSVVISFGDHLLRRLMFDLRPYESIPPQLKSLNTLLPVLEFFREGLESLHSGSLSLEAICCLEIFHWIIGVKYVHSDGQKAITRRHNSALCAIMTVSFVLKLLRRVLSWQIQPKSDSQMDLSRDDPLADSCLLCSDTRKISTLALCGHVFCWNCSYRWFTEHKSCPICRRPGQPSELVLLRNFV